MTAVGPRPKILIAVICYNEAQNIQSTLRELADANFGYDIVVVDNCSTDDSPVIVKSMNVKVLRHCVNTGSSVGTLVTYLTYARRYHYDVVCQVDADGQHIAKELHKIIDPVLSGQCDLCIGSRFLLKQGFQSLWYRRPGIWMFSKLISLLSGQSITDATSGFRAYGTRTIALLGAKYQREIYDSVCQMLLLSSFANLKILEVPVVMRPRRLGVSEFTPLKSLIFPVRSIFAILDCLLNKRYLATLIK